MLIDLQVHSTYSDGYLSPTEVAEFLAKQGVKVASMTDHNTVGGIEEFRRACQRLGVKPIVGLELYVKHNNKKFNLLWYNFDENDPDLHRVLRNSQSRRRGMVRRILYKLESEGFKLRTEQMLDKYAHYIPINHMVDDIMAIKENRDKLVAQFGYVPREGEAIKALFYHRKSGLRESYISFSTIIKLRSQIGGQLILNHPGKYNHLQYELVKRLKEEGIDGIEVISPHHNIGAVLYAQHLAKEFDLIASGSTDFHRYEGSDHSIQHAWDYFKVESDHLRKIEQIIG